MARELPNPFDSLESAHEYVSLLREALEEASASIVDDVAGAQGTKGAERRLDALRLVEHKLARLRQHVQSSLILLNDLRLLRRLLLAERQGADSEPADEP